MKGRESGFFWPSFTDLMTSLFFIMLVLYVLTYVKMEIQQHATEEQLKKIQQIQASVKALDTNLFKYDKIIKRFTLRKNVEFITKTAELKTPSDSIYLINVGKSLEGLINNLKIKYKGQDIRYVLIMEGQASNDNYKYNYELSYARSLAIHQMWVNNTVQLDTTVCDLQISGSGKEGLGRFNGRHERENQRIMIQIVPKIGDIKLE